MSNCYLSLWLKKTKNKVYKGTPQWKWPDAVCNHFGIGVVTAKIINVKMNKVTTVICWMDTLVKWMKYNYRERLFISGVQILMVTKVNLYLVVKF